MLPRKVVRLQVVVNHAGVLCDDLWLVYHNSRAAVMTRLHASVGDDWVISGIHGSEDYWRNYCNK